MASAAAAAAAAAPFVQPSLEEFEASLRLAPGHKPIVPIKSPEDDRSYRIITLPNALTALLISDPTTDKSAASLDVNVGSFAEPSDALGLAHFLEHMLFMGTTKYPDEQSYSLAINNYGGGQNAYTTREHTNYIFDVTPPHLEEVLDRFAQFFVSPLCLKSAVDRELTAVNNEHEKNIQVDVWRLNQLAESALNPAHPVSRFSTGNFVTLRDEPKAKGIDIREKLLEFYYAHYSANLMKLCVVGREDLDTLERWVTTSFSDVKNLGLKRPDFLSIPLALPEHTRTLTRIVPVKNCRSLELEWILPPTHHQCFTQPARLIAHCCAHEAEGSLAYLLKERSLVNELRSGTPEQNSSYSLGQIQMELTESGLQSIDEIIALTFSYLHMLRRSMQSNPKVWRDEIFEEVRAVQEMEFLFREKSEPVYFAEDLAAHLSAVPAEHILSSNRMLAYDHSQLVDLVDRFCDSSNLRVRVCAPEFKDLPGLQKEQWYQTEFTVEKLSESLLAKLAAGAAVPEFALPKKNPYIAVDFSLKHTKLPEADRNEPPLRIQCGCHAAPAAAAAAAAAAAGASSNGASSSASSSTSIPHPHLPAELFFKADRTFAVPKVQITIQLSGSLVNASATNLSLANLWQDILDDALSDVNHFASEAGLGSYCWPASTGLFLSFNGFSDKISLLVQTVLPKIKSLRVAGVREKQFKRLKEQMLRTLTQYKKNTALVFARDDARVVRTQQAWTVDDQLASFEAITAADIDAYSAEWFKRAQLFVAITGNMTEAEARAFTEAVAAAFQLAPLLPAEQPSSRCINLAEGATYVRQCRARNPDDSNSCAFNVYQIGVPDDACDMEAHTTLLSHILGDALFDQLRTKETLGYLVQGYQNRVAGVLHYQIAVQSSDASADYLDHRIEAFLLWFRSTRLAELIAETPEFLEQNKAAVVANLTEKEKNQHELHQRLWGEIERRRFDWAHQDRVAAAVSLITLDSLLAFWDRYLAMSAPQRRKMSFQYFSQGGESPHALPPKMERYTAEAVKFANEKLVLKAKPKEAASAEAVAAAAAPAAASESVFLPPVPVDPRPIKYIEDVVAFKNSMGLYPAML